MAVTSAVTFSSNIITVTFSTGEVNKFNGEELVKPTGVNRQIVDPNDFTLKTDNYGLILNFVRDGRTPLELFFLTITNQPTWTNNEAGVANAQAAIAAVMNSGSGGGPPSGAAGGVLSGTYPDPGLATSVALPGSPTTTTQAASDNSTKVATTAYVDSAIGATSKVERSITQTAHGFSVGDILYLVSTTYAKATADTAAHSEAVGIVASVTSANVFVMITNGYVNGLSGLTAGAVYFLSPTTAGLLTATEPSTSGQISKPLLVADTTTSGYFTNQRGSILP